MSKSLGRTSPTIVVGFGDNYYRNMGTAVCTSLPHHEYDDDDDDDNKNTINLNHDHADDNTNTFNKPNQTVPTYRFVLDEKGNKKAESPPWEQEDDPLIDVHCTITSTFFLTQSGKIYTCGTLHGQVRPALTRTVITLPLRCVQISAGRHFCLARMEGGLAVCAWGAGHFGQLGLGNESPPFVDHPTIIERLLPHVLGSPVSSVAAGYWHSMAVTQAGAVYAWGCNRNSQCGMKPVKEPPTVCIPQLVKFDPPATTPNGTGSSDNEVIIDKIAAGRSHSVALDGAGQVYCWGACQYGQSGLINRRRGGVAPPKHVEALSKVKIVDISAGDAHTLALTGGGRVFGWGGGFDGQLGTGSIVLMNPKPKLVGDLDFVAIEAGQEWKIKQKQHRDEMEDSAPDLSDSATALTATGLAPSTTGTASAAGTSHAHTLAGVPRIVSVTAKGNSSFAISSSGHVYAWGCNDVGNLGLPKHNISELTYADPGQAVTKTSTLRQFHTYSFDSSHNVALPQRLDAIRHLHITAVGPSPTFLWCLGTKRPENDDRPVGRTLYEVQEARREKTLQHHRNIIRAVDDGGFGTSTTGSTKSNTDVSFLHHSDHHPSRDPPEMKNGSTVDGGSLARSPIVDDDDEQSSEGSTSHHSQTIDGTIDHTKKLPKTPNNSSHKPTSQKSLGGASAGGTDLGSPSTPSKKKRIFSPKKLVKAIVRRAHVGSRSDITTTVDSQSETKGSY